MIDKQGSCSVFTTFYFHLGGMCMDPVISVHAWIQIDEWINHLKK